MSTMRDDPRIADAQPIGILDNLRRRLARAELGPLPILLGLGVIWAIFQIANPNFLTPLNLTNLMLQIAATGTIAIGVVLVLLLGEIDLSLGAVSGLSAAIMAVLLQSTLSIAQVPEAGRNILYGLIILVMLFVYGRGKKVSE